MKRRSEQGSLFPREVVGLEDIPGAVKDDKQGWVAGWLLAQPAEFGVSLTPYKVWKARDWVLQADVEYVAWIANEDPSQEYLSGH